MMTLDPPPPTPSAIKMDELLVGWLGSNEVYDNVLEWIDKFKAEQIAEQSSRASSPIPGPPESPQTVLIPPFYPLKTMNGAKVQRRRSLPRQFETWEPLPESLLALQNPAVSDETPDDELQQDQQQPYPPRSVKEQFVGLVEELGFSPFSPSDDIPMEAFVRITKEICRFPSFFNGPFYQRLLDLWNAQHKTSVSSVTLKLFEWYWKTEMEPYDAHERLFRLLKQPHENCILRDDFLPYIKALLSEHPVRTNRCASYCV